MSRSSFLILALCTLLAVSCSSEDPRLPQQLYDEAAKLSADGKNLEAKSMMEMVATRYPESESGQMARKDLYRIDLFLKNEIQEKQKQLRVTMKRVADALTRYKGRKGEYPATLQELVPEYLEKIPVTDWGHPFFYRPYVKVPIEDVKDRHGNITQCFNRLYDGYQLACLGVDMQPGGEGMASDSFIVDGEFFKERSLPTIPLPQPVR
jgi:hypothetical protein